MNPPRPDPADTRPPQGRAPGVRAPDAREVGAAALLLSGSVLLSRLLGFVREAVLAYHVGAGASTDAYKAAFQIPDLLNYFLAGGALSIAFIPLYTRRRERDPVAADAFAGVVLGTVSAVAVVATAALWWATPALVDLAFSGFDAETRALTARLTRIVLPAQVFIVSGGILRAVLMARGSFVSQAAAGLIYNLGIILGGLLLAPSFGVEGFSWGCLAGAALGPFLLPWWDLRRRGVTLRLRVRPLDAGFRSYLALALPLMAGVTLLTMDEWYDRFIGNHFAVGTIATLFYARALMQAPIAMVGQAVATAALPALARRWSEGDGAAVNRLVLSTLRGATAVALLGGAALFALADPVVTLVYERGAFSGEDGRQVAALLRIMCWAVPAWVIQQIAVRAFYAREQMWAPMLLGTGIALLALPLYLALGRGHGAAGLAGAGAIAINANALATLLLARRMHGGPELRRLAGTALRCAVIAGAAAFTVPWVALGRPGLLGTLLELALGGVVFCAVAALGIRLLGDDAVRAPIARLLARLRRAPAP